MVCYKIFFELFTPTLLFFSDSLPPYFPFFISDVHEHKHSFLQNYQYYLFGEQGFVGLVINMLKKYYRQKDLDSV